MTLLRYAGVRLCATHFTRSVEARVKAELRRQLDLGQVERIGVAVSGGKDSATCAAILADVVGPRRRPELVAIAVDEGIPGYRDRALETCRAAMERLGLPLHVARHEDRFGLTTDDAARLDPERAPCAACGPWRRAVLNDAARRLGCDVLATGHNLDDMAQSILMDLLKGDLGRLARLAPHAPDERVEGLVPRILPLRTIPERETALYAHLRARHAGTPRGSPGARAGRGRVRDLLLRLVEDDPTVRHTLLATADRLRPLLRTQPAAPPSSCRTCGDPAGTGPLCQACALAAALQPAR